MYVCQHCGAINSVHDTASASVAHPPAETPAVPEAPASVDGFGSMAQAYQVAEDRAAEPAPPPPPEEASDAGPDDDGLDRDSRPTVPVRKGPVVGGLSLIALCSLLGLFFGQLPWVGAALTFVATLGGALAMLGLEVEMKRPRLGRVVLAAAGAMAVLLLEPVARIGSLIS